MKKILLVSNMYPSKKYPHYGVFVKNTYDILAKENKISKLVITKIDNKILKIFNYMIFYVLIVINGLFGRYNIIYSHFASHTGLPLIVLKKLKPNANIIMNVHGNDVVFDNEYDKKYEKIVKKVLNISNTVIVPSIYFKKILIDNYKIDSNKIEIFPSGGVDCTIFKKIDRDTSLKKINLEPKFKYIGYISRIEQDKGWDIFIDSINLLKNEFIDYKYVIVGTGKEYKIMLNKIVELKLDDLIFVRNFVSQDELKYYYNSFDIFCFPTHRKSESLGLVGLEAMACERIIVASDFGGPKTYVVNGENGFLFVPGDSIDLFHKIKQINNINDVEKEIIRKKARKKALLYDKNNISKTLLDFFDNINS